MKKIIQVSMAVSAILIMSCNSKTSTEATPETMPSNDMNMPMAGNSDEPVAMVSATFTSVDPGVSDFMKTMVTNYLSLKNALTDDKESDAASSAGKMLEAMKAFDKSLMTSDQKNAYDGLVTDLKEHAEHISKSKIDNQREHFAGMSNDMYQMVKSFGAGMTLYHDHCPMAQDNKGAMWLSETKEIRNPYFGESMMTCGTVEEMFQ